MLQGLVGKWDEVREIPPSGSSSLGSPHLDRDLSSPWEPSLGSSVSHASSLSWLSQHPTMTSWNIHLNYHVYNSGLELQSWATSGNKQHFRISAVTSVNMHIMYNTKLFSYLYVYLFMYNVCL